MAVIEGEGANGTSTIEADVEAFLRAALPPAWVEAIDTGDAAALTASRAQLDLTTWWRSLADAGYATPRWPVEYGGLGADPEVGAEIARALNRYRVPRFTNPVGITQAGTALLNFGSPSQKERFLRPIARHEEVWCQLFSEPGAGSDLAGLSTRAVRDGDEWVVNGQKVWTSLAHLASYGLLLARTDPSQPKHRGITAFLVPMHSPGVTVRPLRHMAGEVEFNEVFLDDVRIGDHLRLGEVNDGWQIASSVLHSERQAGGGREDQLPGTTTGRSLEGLIRHHTPILDATTRQRVIRLYIESEVLRLTSRRAAARRRAGMGVGPEASILKLFSSEHSKRVQSLACDLEGPGGQAWEDTDRWRKNTAWSLLRIQSKTIAGGTSEIQRNILGERILGLPRDHDPSRNAPWSEVRHT